MKGTTISFTGAVTPFTLAANATYFFAPYAISLSASAPTPAPSIAPITPTPAPTTAPSASPTPTLAPNTYLIASGATITLPLSASGVTGYSAAITLPTTSASTTATVLTSTAPPAKTGAAPGTPLFYASITPATAVTFTSGTVSGTYTAPATLTGSYKLSILAPGLGWVSGTAATPSGSSVSFSYTLNQAVTLNAGATYVIAISKV